MFKFKSGEVDTKAEKAAEVEKSEMTECVSPENVVQHSPIEGTNDPEAIASRSDVKGMILTRLMLKYFKTADNDGERIAYMHAIMREFGAWFHKVRVFNTKKKTNFRYEYILHSSKLENGLFNLGFSLILRYRFLTINFQKTNEDEHVQLAYSYTHKPSLVDNFYYTRSFKSGGCPSNIFSNQ